MVQLWNTSANPVPTGSTGGADRFADHTSGINTVATHYYGTADPSSGASWGADELGVIWFDSNNAIGAGGDGLGLVVKRWEVATDAPTYGWRTLGARIWTALEPNVNVLTLANQSTTAFTDLDLTSDTSAQAIAVLLMVEVEDSGTIDNAVYAELRKNGTTTDAQERRVHVQVTDIPNTCMMLVECDAAQTIEWAINASAATTFDLRIDVLGYYERA